MDIQETTQRQIKFRGWHNGFEGKHGVAAHMIYDEKSGDCLVWKNQGQNIEAIMQFTGLHDRCGNDVYEKDVLTHNENSNNISDRGLVIYIDGRNVVEMFGTRKMTYELYDTIYNSGMTVIGNIYENIELLKETE